MVDGLLQPDPRSRPGLAGCRGTKADSHPTPVFVRVLPEQIVGSQFLVGNQLDAGSPEVGLDPGQEAISHQLQLFRLDAFQLAIRLGRHVGARGLGGICTRIKSLTEIKWPGIATTTQRESRNGHGLAAGTYPSRIDRRAHEQKVLLRNLIRV